jgi:hypothetical protein
MCQYFGITNIGDMKVSQMAILNAMADKVKK